jgi:hypothetical protein
VLLYSTLRGADEVPHTLMGRPTRTPVGFLPRSPPALSSSSLVLVQFLEARPSFYPSFGHLYLWRSRAPHHQILRSAPLNPEYTGLLRVSAAASHDVDGFAAPSRHH